MYRETFGPTFMQFELNAALAHGAKVRRIRMGLIALLKAMFISTPTKALAADETESAKDLGVDSFNPFPEPVQIEITDVIDLHTIQPRDVKRVVEEYLFQAHEAGFRSVRIIHGKGIGVQREIVRSTLTETPFVEGWTNAPQEAGGWGATIVRFK
jgi:dsDNA-specific endonuclease/ATPase MutS2